MIVTVDSEQHAIAKFWYLHLLDEIVQYEKLKEYLKIAITATLVPDMENCMKIVVFSHFWCFVDTHVCIQGWFCAKIHLAVF